MYRFLYAQFKNDDEIIKFHLYMLYWGVERTEKRFQVSPIISVHVFGAQHSRGSEKKVLFNKVCHLQILYKMIYFIPAFNSLSDNYIGG